MAVGAVIGSVATGVLGAKMSSDAASDAAQAQVDAANAAAKAQLEMFYSAQEERAPWTQAGAGAVNALWGGGAGGTAGTAPRLENYLISGGTTKTAKTTTSATSNPDFILKQLQAQGLVGPYGSAQSAANMLYKVGVIKSADPSAAVNYLLEYTGQSSPEAYNKVQYIKQTAKPAQYDYDAYNKALAAYNARQGAVKGTGTGLIQKGPGQFKESEGYKWTLGQGLQGIQRAASASGRLGSGAYLKDATKYAEGLASTEYDAFLDRYYKSLDPYFRMAGLGSNMAQTGTQASTSTANSLAQIALQKGQAQAAGNLGAAYPWTQLANYGANQLGQYATNQYYNQNLGNANALNNYWQSANYTPAQMNTMSWL